MNRKAQEIKMSKTTMEDIAKIAGVSKITVSRAIHNPKLVSYPTREKIQKVIEEHQYVYNANAAELSSKKTSMIGLIIPTVKSSIHAEVIHGIQQQIRETKHTLVIGHCEYNIHLELELINTFRQRRLAGIILTGSKPETIDIIKTTNRNGIPCVLIWETINDPELSYVGFDNYKSSYMMTNFLIGLGHEKIAFIMGPYQQAERLKQRFKGYREALAKYRLPFDPELVVSAKEPNPVDGREAMDRILTLKKNITAVFAVSDALAMGALTSIKEHGLKVPHDISVAGFDDIDFASFCDPPLTTIRVPAQEMGKKAITVIQEMLLYGSNHVRQYCLNTDLIVRGSCRKI